MAEKFYCMPYTTLFPGQEPNEKIIMVLRRHWWILFRIIFLYVVLALFMPVLRWLANEYTNLFDGGTLTVILNLITSLYYFYIITFFFHAWIDYYLDIWIITSERIVDIEQRGLFSRHISTQRLYRIQDVYSEVQGFLPTFFHFGDVHVQTAGQNPRFVFKQIPNSYEVTKKIIALVRWKKQKMIEQGINFDDTEHG